MIIIKLEFKKTIIPNNEYWKTQTQGDPKHSKSTKKCHTKTIEKLDLKNI